MTAADAAVVPAGLQAAVDVLTELWPGIPVEQAADGARALAAAGLLVPVEPAAVAVQLPWHVPPLSMNDRHHWAEHGRLVREVRDTARWVIRAARLGSHRYVEVCLHWRPCRDGRRDADNPSATAKVVFDAAVDEGLVPGDEPRHMRKLMPEIHPADKALGPAMWLTVRVLA